VPGAQPQHNYCSSENAASNTHDRLVVACA
jgi:hypothetical protein